MNKQELMENELTSLHESIEEITKSFEQGRVDENNDLVLPESAAIRIKLLLEDV